MFDRKTLKAGSHPGLEHDSLASITRVPDSRPFEDGQVYPDGEKRESLKSQEEDSAPLVYTSFRETPRPLDRLYAPRYCTNRFFRGFSPKTGKPIYQACGRPRCSYECRDQWARKWGNVLERSFRALPPTHHLRITVQDLVGVKELTAAMSKFTRNLKYWLRNDCEYFIMNEWRDRHRHHHLLVRTDHPLPRSLVRELWSKALPGKHFTHYCCPVRNPARMAHYLVKNVSSDEKKELSAFTFTGRLWTYSRGFLSKSSKELWEEVKAEWEAKRGGSNVQTAP